LDIRLVDGTENPRRALSPSLFFLSFKHFKMKLSSPIVTVAEMLPETARSSFISLDFLDPLYRGRPELALFSIIPCISRVWTMDAL